MKRNIKLVSLIMSVVAIVVLFTMLIGSTFAWFTDSATSSGNKIKAGTLKVDLEILDENGWSSLKENKDPIFDYDLWEPGYTDIKILKVENEGTLALQWKAKFVSKYQLSELANVIDVYVLSSQTEIGYPTSRDLDGYVYAGTVADFFSDIETKASGSLLANEEVYLGIALKMRDTVGNEYQGAELGDFDIQIIATQFSSESDGFNDSYDSGAQFPETEISLLSGAFKLLDDPNTTIQIINGEAVLAYNGVVQGKIPKECVSITDNVITISGVGAEDGVYTVHESGYIDKDGEIIAKSELAWLEVETGEYFVVNDGLVYLSLDGNNLYSDNGSVEPMLDLNQLSTMVDDYISSTGMTADEFYDAYGYRFTENGQEEFVVGNLFDFLAVQNIVDKGQHHWGIYTGRYDYWGGSAKDVKTEDALVFEVNWAETDLDAIVTTKVYLVTNEGEKLLSVNEPVEGGTVKVVQEIKYYYNGEETENVMFFEDYALYFEDGMTYGEWMRENFIMQLHDLCNGMHDHNGIYIPEQYLDKLCEPGYRYEIQSAPDRIYNDYLGYYYSNGKSWTMEMIFYSYGKTYIRPTNFNDEGYKFVGMAWEGGLQTDGSIYADEYYNYFIRNGLTPKAVPFYSAFVAESDTCVDISDYLTLNSSNQVVVDVTALTEAFDLEGNISVIPVYEKDGYLVDCRNIGCTYNEEIQDNYYQADKEWLSNRTFGNGATGITFYYNGVTYTGFVR